MLITNTYSSEVSAQLLKMVVSSSHSCPYLTPRTQSEVINWLQHGYIYYGDVEGQIVGWLVMEPLTENCLEMKSFYVIPMYNGRGYGSEILDFCMKQGKEFLSVSSNPQVIKMLLKRGFNKLPLIRLPLKVLLSFLISRKTNSFKKGFQTKFSFLYKK